MVAGSGSSSLGTALLIPSKQVFYSEELPTINMVKPQGDLYTPVRSITKSIFNNVDNVTKKTDIFTFKKKP